MRFPIGVFAPLLAPLAPVLATGDSALAQFALDNVLRNGRDIFGDTSERPSSFSEPAAHSRHANWMAGLPDTIPLTQLTIPGTHDAATWNYTQETQDSLAFATRCDGTSALPARVYRCQRRSVVAALDSGIRFFDLRVAADPLDARLAFWHGPALLSDTAALQDVLFGFFAWLDAHPSEAVLLSLQYERGTRANATADARVQRRLAEALASPVAARYVDQRRGGLGVLGEVRGKIVLVRRFDLDALPEGALPGLHMSPAKWVDNGRAFELVFNESVADGGGSGSAFIEDYYHPDGFESVAGNIGAKFEAVEDHLRKAARQDFDSLFITFTSATHVEVNPPVYPDVMALGTPAGNPPVRGVNERLRELLKEMKGRRLGVVVMDFFEEPDGLVDLLLDF